MVDSSWNVMASGDTQEGKWRGNWRTEWVASTLHTTSEHGVSSITTADTHTSAAISRLNWRPRRFKWTRPFRWKAKSGFCACAITFQLASRCSDSSRFACRYASPRPCRPIGSVCNVHCLSDPSGTTISCTSSASANPLRPSFMYHRVLTSRNLPSVALSVLMCFMDLRTNNEY